VQRYAAIAIVLVAAVIATSCGGRRATPPPGRYLVYTKHLARGTPSVWIANTDGTHARLLVRNAVFGALSPDGRWVVYGRIPPSALYLVAASGGKARLLARSVSYPTWSPRSDRILALGGNTLLSVDLDGHLRVVDQSPAVQGWSFSPDGRWIVYVKERKHTECGGDLFIESANGGEERRLTHGRDMFPVWGPHWIAFSRFPKSCAYARRIWRIRPDGSGARPVTAPPPRRFASSGYYGLDPIDWAPDGRVLLAGIASEWGPVAIRVDVGTGAFRKLSGYALDLSQDGRLALVDSGGAEGPQKLASVAIASGRTHTLAYGDVAYPSWNR
jgi:Tol biopolymer transport system component